MLLVFLYLFLPHKNVEIENDMLLHTAILIKESVNIDLPAMQTPVHTLFSFLMDF